MGFSAMFICQLQITLRGKHCRHLIVVTEVVGMSKHLFQKLSCLYIFWKYVLINLFILSIRFTNMCFLWLNLLPVKFNDTFHVFSNEYGWFLGQFFSGLKNSSHDCATTPSKMKTCFRTTHQTNSSGAFFYFWGFCMA